MEGFIDFIKKYWEDIKFVFDKIYYVIKENILGENA